jgi:hypothetical protein
MLIIALVLILIIAGVVEKQRHESRLRRIPVRIHINGTRGKSTLTRLITSLLSGTGFRVAAKVTGEHPEYYSPDSGWSSWKRWAPPRIKEQLRFLKTASEDDAKAVVIENMALAPENQFVSEHLMVKSTMSLLSNVRIDHREVMGRHLQEIAGTLACAFPRDGELVMNERSHRIFDGALLPHRTTICTVDKTCENPIERMSMPILEYVKTQFNIPDSVFESVVWSGYLPKAIDDLIIQYDGRSFVNLFSCNDVISADELIDYLTVNGRIGETVDLLLMCRRDRPFRTIDFLDWALKKRQFRIVTIAGQYPLFPVMKRCRGISNVRMIRGTNPKLIVARLTERRCKTVICIGNYVRTGERIIEFLQGDAS